MRALATGSAADPPGEVWLVRHGETPWSRDGLHTSHSDPDLTERGEASARALAGRLRTERFDLVLTSPRLRARRTAALAGFAAAEADGDLVEWDYGRYEGISTPEIRRSVPGWTVWTHPCPGGETAQEVSERLDRVIARARAAGGRTLLFGHGHALRALAARWIGQEVTLGRSLRLDTGTLSTLGWERESPVILCWNAGAR